MQTKGEVQQKKCPNCGSFKTNNVKRRAFALAGLWFLITGLLSFTIIGGIIAATICAYCLAAGFIAPGNRYRCGNCGLFWEEQASS